MSTPNEKPILFNGEMVRAILDGRKTQTRRIMKLQPSIAPIFRIDAKWGVIAEWPGESEFDGYGCHCPYGVAGDRLWVRETFAYLAGPSDAMPRRSRIAYKADRDGRSALDGQWKPSIHMPRWASRITLEIVNVLVERVQEIGITGCKAEGIEPPQSDYAEGRAVSIPKFTYAHIGRFRILWDSIHGKDAWERNDWVWVVEFKKL